MRRFLRWALEFWTGDRYVRVEKLWEYPTSGWASALLNNAVKFAREHERDR